VRRSYPYLAVSDPDSKDSHRLAVDCSDLMLLQKLSCQFSRFHAHCHHPGLCVCLSQEDHWQRLFHHVFGHSNTISLSSSYTACKFLTENLGH
jgi:hypothetical protein